MRVVLVFVLCSLLNQAFSHDDKSNNLQRSLDSLRVLRNEEATLIKTLSQDGIQLTRVIGKNREVFSWTLSDFTEKKSCYHGKGKLLISVFDKKIEKVQEACEREGLKVDTLIESKDLIGCVYDCSKVTTNQIQKIFFNPNIQYLEPSVRRQ